MFKKLFIAVSILIIATFVLCQLTYPTLHPNRLSAIDSTLQQHLLRTHLPEKLNTFPITIVDIDEPSLNGVGRWPWPRKTLQQLFEKIHAAGADTIATDIVFSEGGPNPLKTVLDNPSLNLPSTTAQALQSQLPLFDEDKQLGEVIKKDHIILGFILHNNASASHGVLPAALSEKPLKQMVHLKGYSGNVAAVGQNSQAGFITTLKDDDGVLRKTPLVLAHHGKVYPSLSLAAIINYLNTQDVKLAVKHGNLHGIFLDQLFIPTAPDGTMIIPFQGNARAFPTVSAHDVLLDKISPDLFKGRLVFIGVSVLGMGDALLTPVDDNFPGVEVQATMAYGMLHNLMPYTPPTATLLIPLFMVFIGALLSILFYYRGVSVSWAIALFYCLINYQVSSYMWQQLHWHLLLGNLYLMVIMLAVFKSITTYAQSFSDNQKIKTLFNQYVPPEHVDMLCSEDGAALLESREREMTALFCDIRNFTAISESLTPEKLQKFLNLFLTHMTHIIFNHNGTIDKYVGDMVMAFWGAPIEDTDHAKHAITCAQAMLKELEALNEDLARENLPEIDIGIGVNTGTMIVGDMGSEFRKAYTIISDAVNLASRLESLTKEYQVKLIVGESTVDKTKNDFNYHYLDEVTVKGKREATKIYSLSLM